MRRAWTPADDRAMRKLHRAGHTLGEITAHLGRSSCSLVGKKLAEAGLIVRTARRPWTKDDDRAMRKLHRAGLTASEIAARLGRTHCSMIRGKLEAAGLVTRARRDAFTADEDQTIRINYPTFPAFLIAHVLRRSVSSINQRANRLGLKKASDSWRQWHTPLWANYDHPAAVACRFKKGLTPHNKGLRRPGYAPGRMGETQFKKGEMHGAAQHNYVPIGTLRINTKDGYLERKVTDDHPVPARRWVAVHRLVWEAARGAIPAGGRVAFRPGMKTNVEAEITVDRLELVTAAEMMRRNTIHNYPKEIVRATQMRAALNRSINRVKNKRASP